MAGLATQPTALSEDCCYKIKTKTKQKYVTFWFAYAGFHKTVDLPQFKVYYESDNLRNWYN